MKNILPNARPLILILLIVLFLGIMVGGSDNTVRRTLIGENVVTPTYITVTARANDFVSPLITEAAPINAAKMEILSLQEKNTVILRGPVTDDSVAHLIKEISFRSVQLHQSETIYLVLDTPGGSVDAGNLLISYIKALPQKVKTVSIFAASMGFHIAQSLDERLILETGTLMSHRAKLSGVRGEIPGELIVRLNAILKTLNRMDTTAAHRMGMDVKAYQHLIRDEYWVDGIDAIEDGAADRVVLIRCSGAMLKNVYSQVFYTFFGPITVTFSKCPMLRQPLSVDFTKARSAPDKFIKNFKRQFNDPKTWLSTNGASYN